MPHKFANGWEINMTYLHQLNVLPTEDDKDVVSDEYTGVYLVHKKNLIAQFSFGLNGTFTTGNEAHQAMTNFLQSRKDSDMLRVTLL